MIVMSCGSYRDNKAASKNERAAFTNPIRPRGSSPCIVYHNGKYYYTQSNYVRVSLWCSETIDGLKDAKEHIAYSPHDTYYISGPRLHRIDGKWYIYYSSEGKDISTRQIHVLENASDDPLEGSWTYRAAINTGHVKSVHPYVFKHEEQNYMLWSGYDGISENGIDIFRIYIGKMENPWTLSGRVSAILYPKYEWECQWISNNGLAEHKPAYVNEAPVAIHSRDSSKVLLYFAASQTYSSYYCAGLATASADSDLLSPSSWTKLPDPVFSQNPEVAAYGAGHVSFFSAGNDLYMIYQAYSETERTSVDNRSPRMQLISWNKEGIPVLGRPASLETVYPEPIW